MIKKAKINNPKLPDDIFSYNPELIINNPDATLTYEKQITTSQEIELIGVLNIDNNNYTIYVRGDWSSELNPITRTEDPKAKIFLRVFQITQEESQQFVNNASAGDRLSIAGNLADLFVLHRAQDKKCEKKFIFNSSPDGDFVFTGDQSEWDELKMTADKVTLLSSNLKVTKELTRFD